MCHIISRTISASPCLDNIPAANSNVKPSSSSLQVIHVVSSTLERVPPAQESVPITATVIPSALGGVLIFISILVAVTVFFGLRAKRQKKKMIDVLEQEFQKR